MMDLTPNDIRSHEFPTQLRGYDKDEVDNFAEQVAVALEESKQEALKLSMEIESLKSQLSALKQFEDAIKNAAIDARRNADITVSNAKQEAELILGKARSEAQKVIEAHTQNIRDIELQLSQISLTKRSYVSKFKGLINSHLELIEEIECNELSAAGEGALEITDSSEVEAKTRETVASQPSEPKGIKTEEANAPGAIRQVEPEDNADETTEAVQASTGDEMAATPKPPDRAIDPELAAALENYKKVAQGSSPDALESSAPPPKPDEVVETTSRAEDIPPGFLAANDTEINESTDKIGRAEKSQDQPMEHSPIAADDSTSDREEAPPEDLAKSLEEVAAKFEEEMDKAAKN